MNNFTNNFTTTEAQSSLDFYRLKTEYYRKECNRYRHLWSREKLGCDSLRRKLSKSSSSTCNCQPFVKLTECNHDPISENNDRDPISEKVTTRFDDKDKPVQCSKSAIVFHAQDHKEINNSSTDRDADNVKTDRQKPKATVKKIRPLSLEKEAIERARKCRLKEMRKRNPLVKFSPTKPVTPGVGREFRPPARLDFVGSRNNHRRSFSPQKGMEFPQDLCPNVPLHPYTNKKTHLVQRPFVNTNKLQKHIHGVQTAAHMIKNFQSNYTNFPRKMPMGDGENKTFLNRQRLSAARKYVVVDVDAEKNQAAGESTLKNISPKAGSSCSQNEVTGCSKSNAKCASDKSYSNRFCDHTYDSGPALGYVSIIGKSVLSNRSKTISELGTMTKVPNRFPRSVYACY